MNEDKIARMVKKIKALKAKADTSKGATEAEAKAFMAKAAELMTKHKIEEINLADEDNASEIVVDRSNFEVTRTRYPSDSFAFTIMEEMYSVKIFTQKGFIPNIWNVIVIGAEEDREMAGFIMPLIMEFLNKGYNRFLKCRGLTRKVQTCKSYCFGVVDGYIEKIEESKQRMLTELECDATRYAITITEAEAAIDAYVSEMSNVKVQKSKAFRPDSESYFAGKEDGKSANFIDNKLQ